MTEAAIYALWIIGNYSLHHNGPWLKSVTNANEWQIARWRWLDYA